MGAGNEKRQFGLRYGHKTMMEVGVYFKQEVQLNILLWSNGYVPIGWLWEKGNNLNNWRKYLILFVAVLFIGEEWRSLFPLLNTVLSRQICSDKVAEKSILWIKAFYSIEHLSLALLCSYLSFKFLAFWFFSQCRVLFHFKNLL